MLKEINRIRVNSRYARLTRIQHSAHLISYISRSYTEYIEYYGEVGMLFATLRESL